MTRRWRFSLVLGCTVIALLAVQPVMAAPTVSGTVKLGVGSDDEVSYQGGCTSFTRVECTVLIRETHSCSPVAEQGGGITFSLVDISAHRGLWARLKNLSSPIPESAGNPLYIGTIQVTPQCTLISSTNHLYPAHGTKEQVVPAAKWLLVTAGLNHANVSWTIEFTTA